MKRLIALCLAAALLLCGCGGQQTESSQTTESEPASEPTESTAVDSGSFGLSYLPEYGPTSSARSRCSARALRPPRTGGPMSTGCFPA